MYKTHHLKAWPEPFEALWRREKRHEIRVFDRPFEVNDQFRIFEYDPHRDDFSGRYIRGSIKYISQPGTWGLPDKIGVLSVESYEHRTISSARAREWCIRGPDGDQ